MTDITVVADAGIRESLSRWPGTLADSVSLSGIPPVDGRPWLPVGLIDGWLTIGPLYEPGRPGCPVCAERRRAANRVPNPNGDVSAPPLIGLLATVGSALIRTVIATAEAAVIVRMSLLDGAVRRHRLIPDPLCPACGDLPEDTPPDLDLTTVPGELRHDGSYRLGRLTERLAALRDTFVDPVHGVLASVTTRAHPTAVTAVAQVQPGIAGHESRHGYATSGGHATAEATAIAEALERLGSQRPRGRRTSVRAAYDDVRDVAVDPREFGVHPDGSYRLPGFPFQRFSTRAVTSWVWGFSYARRRAVLIPASMAYHGGHRRGDAMWLAESSSGAALGSAPVEAHLHGVLEIAERDAFLLTWYARLAQPRINPATARDRRIPVLAESLRQRLGVDVRLFALFVDHEIPVVLAIAARADGPPPAIACAAAGHPDPEQAAMAALRELGPLVAALEHRYDGGRAEAMLADPGLVRTMEDHALLFSHPEATERLGFLDSGEVLSFDAVSARIAWPAAMDLRADLAEACRRLIAVGVDVVAVDTTSAEISAAGLTAVKVLAPGALPMTFGHAFRRIEGLPRLHRVNAGANSLPHPFP